LVLQFCKIAGSILFGNVFDSISICLVFLFCFFIVRKAFVVGTVIVFGGKMTLSPNNILIFFSFAPLFHFVLFYNDTKS
jgi:hypothetical protein